MTLFSAEITDETNIILLNSEDAQNIGFSNQDLMKITNTDTNDAVYGLLNVSEQVGADCIVLGQDIAENLGIISEEFVQVESCNQAKITETNVVTIEFESSDYDVESLKSREFQQRLVKFLQRFFFTQPYSVYWPAENADLTIRFPEIEQVRKPIRLQEREEELILKVKPKSALFPFDAILVIDCSASMNKRDIILPNSNNIISALQSNYSGDSAPHQYIRNYLSSFEPKYRIPGREYKIARIQATIASIMLFFNQKISRGLGESCRIILYSGSAEKFEFNGQSDFQASQLADAAIIEHLINDITNPTSIDPASTNFNRPVEILIEQFKLRSAGSWNQKSSKPLMVLFLTDGKPQPADEATIKEIQKNINNLKRIGRKNSEGFVIYTLGVGRQYDMDEDLLKKMARECNGEYHYVDNLTSLTEWFERLAKEFCMTIHHQK